MKLGKVTYGDFMPKNNLNRSWLTESALETLDKEWQHRILLVLEDMITWPQLKYAYAIADSGHKLTQTIGPKAEEVDSGAHAPKTFFFLAAIIEEFLNNINHKSPAQVIIELEHEILYIASCGEMYVVASFLSGVPKGYMAMKLAKRVYHLRNLWRKEHDEKVIDLHDDRPLLAEIGIKKI